MSTETKPKNVHELKCWPEFFNPMAAGLKTFDCRKRDRDFQVGDIIIQREWIPADRSQAIQGSDNGEYTGCFIRQEITFILVGSEDNHLTGIGEDFVVLAVKNIAD